MSGTGFNDAITATRGGRIVRFNATQYNYYYVITPNIGDEVSIYTIGTTDTYLHLYNSSKSQIQTNDDGGEGSNALITFTATDTLYYFRLRSYRTPTGTTSYETTLYYVQDVPQAGTGGFSDAISVGIDETVSMKLVESKPVYLKIGTGELIDDEDYFFDFRSENYAYTAKVEIYNSNRTLLYSSNGFRQASYLRDYLARYRNDGQDFLYMKITGQGTSKRTWTVKPFLTKRIRNMSFNVPKVIFRGTTPFKLEMHITPTDAYDIQFINMNFTPYGDMEYYVNREDGVITFNLFNNEYNFTPTISVYFYQERAKVAYPTIHTIECEYEDNHDFTQGNGTSDNPFLVSTVEDLKGVVNAPWACYRQVNDIDLTGVDWTPIGRLVDYGHELGFYGTYDGDNYKIIGLSNPLFAKIYPNYMMDDTRIAYIKNMTFENVRLIETIQNDTATLTRRARNTMIQNCHVKNGYVEAMYASGLVNGCEADLYGMSIENCSFEGTVKGTYYVGGLVCQLSNYQYMKNCTVKGKIECVSDSYSSTGGLLAYGGMYYGGTIENCHFEGDIKCKAYGGGLVGSIYAVNTIKNCSSKGNIIGTDYPWSYMGGLIGHLIGADINCHIENCFSEGDVLNGYYMGGLIGYGRNFDSIKNSYSIGDVKGDYRSGGLIGELSVYDKDFTIDTCYSEGYIEGKSYVGGLLGAFWGNRDYRSFVTKSYSVGDVKGKFTESDGEGQYIGGFIGYANYMTIKDCFSQGGVHGRNTIGGFIGYGYFTDNVENVYCVTEKLETPLEWGQIGTMFGGAYFNGSSTLKNSFAIVDEVSRVDSVDYSIGDIAGYYWSQEPLENVFVLDTLQIQTNANRQATGTITKEQAKQQATYTNVGWDFASMWVIQEGVSYPVFKLVEFAVYLKNKGTWKEAQAMYSKVKGKWQQITAINVKNKGKWQ